jgi:hypothetical protein
LLNLGLAESTNERNAVHRAGGGSVALLQSEVAEQTLSLPPARYGRNA